MIMLNWSVSPLSSRDDTKSTDVRNEKPESFPETARKHIAGPGPNSQPHVRRKSVIPLDAAILRELASHKRFVFSFSDI